MTDFKKILSKTAENKKILFWVIISAAFIFKYLIYGFNYFPILDDYIQYGGYPLYNDIGYVLLDIGTISARPLAAFLDVAFWGKLWNMPHLMLIFSCLFHLLSCFIFYKTAEENRFELSPIFAIFYLFFPLGSEGSLWLSAASRIVVGLFFSSVAAYALTKYAQQGSIKYYIFFILNALFAFCLYEPCAVFCCLISIAVLIANRKEKRFLLPSVSLVLLFVMLLVYLKLGQNIGRMGSRAAESSIFLIFTQAGDFLSQLFEILTKGVYKLTVNGFSEGLLVLISKGIIGIIYIFAIFLLCILLGKTFSSCNSKKINRNSFIFRITLGVVLFLAPFIPNLMSSPVWITYRTMFIPLVGLYIIFDTLFYAISQKSVQTILLMVFMFMFTVSSVNEYDTFRRTHELDQKLLSAISEKLPESVLKGEREAAVLLDEMPSSKQVSLYKDHVKCTFHEDWALTGALRAYNKAITIKKVTPVYPESDFDYSECFVIDMRGRN